MERNMPEILHDVQTKAIFLPETHVPKMPRIVDPEEYKRQKENFKAEDLEGLGVPKGNEDNSYLLLCSDVLLFHHKGTCKKAGPKPMYSTGAPTLFRESEDTLHAKHTLHWGFRRSCLMAMSCTVAAEAMSTLPKFTTLYTESAGVGWLTL